MSGNNIIRSRAAGVGSRANPACWLELCKIHLCTYIGLSTVFGHVMAEQYFSLQAFITGGAVFILACGSAVLNNIQDRYFDSYFERTCSRVLPQKKVPLMYAAWLGSFLIILGLGVLLLLQNAAAFLAGVLAVACYNGLYTPLKKRSLLAIIPGSACGTLPPLIGWTAAGNSLSAYEIFLIMVIFGLWQIPHFFVILLKNKNEKMVRKKDDGLPCFTKIFSEGEIRLQMLIWTSLYSLAILLFLLSGSISYPFFFFLTFANAILILIVFFAAVFREGRAGMIPAFASINLSLLFFMAAGIGDKLIG